MSGNKITSFKDLIVWQKAIDLSILIYLITKNFPKSELYGLVSQMRRCSVSIPSNIAEGFMRGHKQEYIQFLRIAFGSGAELETQLILALKIKYLNVDDFNKCCLLLDEVMKMLNSLISKFSSGKFTKT